MEENTSDRLDDLIKEERLRETAAGTGMTARRARHLLRRKGANPEACPQGHLYDDENTLYNTAGRRMCLACLRDRRVYPDRPVNPRAMKGPAIDLNNPHQVREDPGGK